MRAAEWMATVPWCMTAEALEAMVSIAERQPLDDIAGRMHGPKSLALRGSTPRDDSAQMTMRGDVALIRIDGPIYRYADWFSAVSGGTTTEALARDLQAALDDPKVASILFLIDSPGGEATGIGELAGAIFTARGQKPIWSYVEGYGASAAYWIASATEHIVVDPSALLGSIGTVLAVANPAAVPQPARRLEVVSTQSPKKRLDPTTQAGKTELQRLVDAMTEVFISAVQQHRGLTREQVLAAEGGLLIGQQAVDGGLADAVGSEEGAIAALQEQAAAARRPALMPLRPPVRAARMEGPMWKEFWAGLFGAAAEAEGAPLQARTIAEGEVLAEGELTEGARLVSSGVVTLGATASSYQLAAAVAPADPEREKMQAEIAQLRAAQAKAEGEARATAAATFADRMVAEGRALPAERDGIARAHAQAASDDAAMPWPAPTSAAEASSRVALLEATYSARPAHSLTSELVPQSQAPAPGASSLPAERRQALLAMTPLGRAALGASKTPRA